MNAFLKIEKVRGFTYNCDFFAGDSPGHNNFKEKGFTTWNSEKFTSDGTPETAKIVDEV